MTNKKEINYSDIFGCYLSGQISEPRWQECLQDQDFVVWLDRKNKSIRRKNKAEKTKRQVRREVKVFTITFATICFGLAAILVMES